MSETSTESMRQHDLDVLLETKSTISRLTEEVDELRRRLSDHEARAQQWITSHIEVVLGEVLGKATFTLQDSTIDGEGVFDCQMYINDDGLLPSDFPETGEVHSVMQKHPSTQLVRDRDQENKRWFQIKVNLRELFAEQTSSST